jgi:nucleoside-diphosphate-sugar epimerase
MAGDWKEYYESTVLGTKNLLEVLYGSGVKKFIYLSSLCVLNYNKLRDHDVVNEDSPVEDKPELRGFYTKAKKESEDLVKQFSKNNKNIKTIIIRPGLVYGKESNKNLENSGVLLGRLLFVFGLGGRNLGLNYVENLSDVLVKVAELACSSNTIFHSVDIDQPKVKAYIKKHNELSKNKIIPIYVPIIIWKVLFKLVDYLLLIKNGSMGSFSYRFASNSKKLKYSSNLIGRNGWVQPYNFDQAITKSKKDDLDIG